MDFFESLTALKKYIYKYIKEYVYADMTVVFLPVKVMETLENNLLKLSSTEYSDPFLGKFMSELK